MTADLGRPVVTVDVIVTLGCLAADGRGAVEWQASLEGRDVRIGQCHISTVRLDHSEGKGRRVPKGSEGYGEYPSRVSAGHSDSEAYEAYEGYFSSSRGKVHGRFALWQISKNHIQGLRHPEWRATPPATAPIVEGFRGVCRETLKKVPTSLALRSAGDRGHD